MIERLTQEEESELRLLCKHHLNLYIDTITPLSKKTSNLLYLVYAGEKKYILKHLQPLTWLGKRTEHEISFNESIASMVGNALKNTTPALTWKKTQHLIPDMEKWLILIPFVEGSIHTVWSLSQSEQLGQTLALLHGCNLPKQEAKPFPSLNYDDFQIPTAWKLSVEYCSTNRFHRSDEWVVSHRDLHTGNILWNREITPYLIDWESVGLIHPLVELIGLATNAAGIPMRRFNQNNFLAVLKGYKTQTGFLPKEDDILWGQCFHSWLLWYQFNITSRKEEEAKDTLLVLEFIRGHLKRMKELYRAEA
ncbi:phosphotransferase [Legionella impletisoli]|uniref:Aminoglycoside phosphotransferase domain-containing protein n=1 Tax=Legionella impletisoli TaxID=343510 RepID=A0A917JVV2_9GAMM|nr:phosphotransferase [Legionella impletisoli]GGI88623.1 hypothetical protein GCM10007966_16690 [Legionella impletisoli]